MTHSFIQSAMRRVGEGTTDLRGEIDSSDDTFLAWAIARVLLSWRTCRFTASAEVLFELVQQTFAIPVDRMVKDASSPTRGELLSVADALASIELCVSPLHQKLAHLCEVLDLEPDDLPILTAFVQVVSCGKFRRFVECAFASSYLRIGIIAQICGIAAEEAAKRLAPQGRLVSLGLVIDERDGDFRVGSLLLGAANIHESTRSAAERYILPEIEDSGLTWEDFAHLGPDRDLAEAVLRAGQPVSILLHGEPGTGKSEFARVLARRVGRGASFAGLVGSNDGMEPHRHERLGHLGMLRRICAVRNDHLIVVDEADDLLSLVRERRASRQFINRLVENPLAPTIWIVNDPASISEASVRRMVLAIHFEPLSRKVRRRIVQRAAAIEGIELNAQELERLAALPATAAVVASGLRAASLSDGGVDAARNAVTGILQAMGVPHKPEAAAHAVYDAALSSADTDLVALSQRLAAAPSRRWSLLLAGPSGTGKTAFAEHLAKCIGLELEVRRPSDLLGPFVGQTEANIAKAFAAARQRAAILLIDEVDTFLFRRDSALQNWEVSAINEMLCQMERLEVPFIATTNLPDRLDPATRRRFTLHVNFRTMTAMQAQELFTARFAMAWPADQPLPVGQTPSDFAVVADRAALLGETRGEQLVRWLREEVEARSDWVRSPIGF